MTSSSAPRSALSRRFLLRSALRAPPSASSSASPSTPHSALRAPRFPASRRHFLATSALGIGSVALAWLLNEDELLA